MKKDRTGSSVAGSGTTRALIIDRANAIINEIGMTEFRISFLASSLGLSPGNITYHFPQKEDLAVELWFRNNTELLNLINTYITPLLDIKQLFLMFKNSYLICYKYRGIIAYRQGDIGVIKRKCWDMSKSIDIYQCVTSQLIANGYLNDNLLNKYKSIVLESCYVHFGWTISTRYTDDDSQIDTMSDKYALELIYQISPSLTEKGRLQLSDIANHVYNN